MGKERRTGDGDMTLLGLSLCVTASTSLLGADLGDTTAVTILVNSFLSNQQFELPNVQFKSEPAISLQGKIPLVPGCNADYQARVSMSELTAGVALMGKATAAGGKITLPVTINGIGLLCNGNVDAEARCNRPGGTNSSLTSRLQTSQCGIHSAVVANVTSSLHAEPCDAKCIHVPFVGKKCVYEGFKIQLKDAEIVVGSVQVTGVDLGLEAQSSLGDHTEVFARLVSSITDNLEKLLLGANGILDSLIPELGEVLTKASSFVLTQVDSMPCQHMLG